MARPRTLRRLEFANDYTVHMPTSSDAAGYSKTPFIKKMGVKEGMRGILLRAPREALRLFKEVSPGFAKALSGKFDYIHLFSKDEKIS